MHAAALRIELRLRDVRSLKAKRSVLRPLLEGLKRTASLSVAEVGRHDSWQRASVGVAVVAPDAAQLEYLLESVRRYLDDRLEVEVLEMSVDYLEHHR